jgi:hypothetical protein
MRISVIFVLFTLIFLGSLQAIIFAEELPQVETSICKGDYKDIKAHMDKYAEQFKILENKAIENIPPSVAFKYYSGNTHPLSNHPLIYAHGSNGKESITVIGCGISKEFLISQFDKAIESYRELLSLNEYTAPVLTEENTVPVLTEKNRHVSVYNAGLDVVSEVYFKVYKRYGSRARVAGMLETIGMEHLKKLVLPTDNEIQTFTAKTLGENQHPYIEKLTIDEKMLIIMTVQSMYGTYKLGCWETYKNTYETMLNDNERKIMKGVIVEMAEELLKKE